jgi:HEAT repeat protein
MKQDFRPPLRRIPAGVRFGVTAPWLLCLTGFLALPLPGRAQEDPLYRGQRLSDYVRALRDADDDGRVKAATALGEMRLPDRSALAALGAALQDRSAKVREKAGSALAGIGPAAIPYLAAALGHADPAVRAVAAASLGQLSPGERAAIPPLIRALGDSESVVHLKAAEALGRFGPAAHAAVPDLVEALRSPCAERRSAAVQVLGKIGPAAGPAVGPLVAVLKEQRRVNAVPRVLEVVEALGWVGPEAREAIPALMETLREKNPAVRLRAAWALLAIGAKSEAVIPVLTSLPDDADLVSKEEGPSLQAQAADLLGWIGPEARTAAPALVRQMIARDHPAGTSALRAVVRIGDDALAELICMFGQTPDPGRKRLAFVLNKIGGRAVPPLVQILDDPRAEVRAAAAQVLGEIGREARAALPQLEQALSDPAVSVRLRAAEALLEVGGRRNLAALGVLARTLQDKEHRADSLRILTYLTPKMESAALAFAELVLDADDEVSDCAWRALTRLDSADPAALQVARRALWATKAARRQKAIEALETLGPQALDNADLIRALADSDMNVRKAALEVCRKRGPEARDTLPALVDALQDRENEVRLQAIKVLGRMGPAAASALPALMAEWGRRDSFDQIANTLRAIGPPALPFIWRAWQDKPKWNRVQIARVLADLAVNARSSVLGALLEDADPAVRGQAVVSLGRAAPEFLRCHQAALVAIALGDGDVTLRRAALTLLGEADRGAAPALRVALRDPVAGIRAYTAGVLVRSPQHVTLAMPVLLQGVRNHSHPELGAAEWALYVLGPEAQPAVPILQRALQDPEDDVRLWAAQALGQIGPAARGAVPVLRQALQDGDPDVRFSAADSLTLIERRPIEALPTLLEDAKRGHQRSNRQFGRTPAPVLSLSRYGTTAMPALVQAVFSKGPDAAVGDEDARWLFDKVKAEARAAVPAFVAALRARCLGMPPLRGGGSTAVPEEMIHTLGKFGPETGDAVPLLVEILAGNHPRLQVAAAEALARTGPAAAAAVPALEGALRERTWMEDVAFQSLGFLPPREGRGNGPVDWWVDFSSERWEFSEYASFEWSFGHDLRSHVAYALGQIGPAARGAVPALREALETRSGPRFRLVEAVWHLSGRADWIVPELVAMLRETDGRGAEVYRLLACIGPGAGEAVPVLTQIVHRALSGRPPSGGGQGPAIPAIQVLGRIGPAARGAIPDLERALQSDEDERRGAAAVALWRIDHRAGQAVPVLVQLLRGQRPVGRASPGRMGVAPWVRVAAAEALGELGAEGKPAVPALRDGLQDKDGNLRVAAATALWRVAGDSASSLPVLLAALRDRDDDNRRTAAEALGRLGRLARPAASALQEALEDGDPDVRRIAAAVLRQMRQD